MRNPLTVLFVLVGVGIFPPPLAGSARLILIFGVDGNCFEKVISDNAEVPALVTAITADPDSL